MTITIEELPKLIADANQLIAANQRALDGIPPEPVDEVEIFFNNIWINLPKDGLSKMIVERIGLSIEKRDKLVALQNLLQQTLSDAIKVK